MDKKLKVLHVSPTHFSDTSFIGGGERYAYELAKASAEMADVTFLSFSDQYECKQDGPLKVEFLKGSFGFTRYPVNPFTWAFIKRVKEADIIHCHQVRTFATDFSLILGKLFKKKVFVTDLGGGDRFALSYRFPLLKSARAYLLISAYSKKLWLQNPQVYGERPLEVIYGGVDEEKFIPSEAPRNQKAVFVGRLLSHKGIDVIIDAVDEKLNLDIVGNVYSKKYYEVLEEKSKGKNVTFHKGLDDKELVEKYQTSLVTILPSLYKDYYGDESLVPELFGLTVIESMACGTPAIVTDVASLPELVEDGVTGFIIPPNNPVAMREKLHWIFENPEKVRKMGKNSIERVRREFTWKRTAERCFEAYEKY